jgi:UDP-glucose 4-epimerase
MNRGLMFWKHASVLVTGGNGFIGSHLVERLVNYMADVTILDMVPTDGHHNLEKVRDKIKIINRLIDADSIADIVNENRFDFIFHLGSNANVPYSVEEPFLDFKSNLFNTSLFLENLRSAKFLGAFLIPSSAAVYGNPITLPVSEDDLTIPISPYGVAKLSSERYLNVYSRLYGIRGASLRLFSVFGPRQRKLVVYDIISRLRANPDRLQLYGNGNEARDFIYVDDVAESFLLVAQNGPLAGEVYNVGTGCATTIQELAGLISRCMNLAPDVTFDEKLPASMMGNPQRWQAEISRIRGLGFTPESALEAGIKKTVEWYDRETLMTCGKAEVSGTRA